MAAIAGIASPDANETVQAMLSRMAHRGGKGSLVESQNGITMGVSWPEAQPEAGERLRRSAYAEDRVSDSHYAWAAVDGKTLTLSRDALGVSPLYIGWDANGRLCFASEVKGLVGLAQHIQELPPGSTRRGEAHYQHFSLPQNPADAQTHPVDAKTHPADAAQPQIPFAPPSRQAARQAVAAELRKRLVHAVEKRAQRGVPFGSWLSGGLDSSALAALARPYTTALHTFAAGFQGAPDLEAAREVARHIQATHHEMIPVFDEITAVIPDVIYHLESFDALLVRSSLMNFLVARMAADYVPAVFSGEGGDELFAGYSYLKQVSPQALPAELVEIIGRLHNTALQRVDRCAAAHGAVAYVAFLDGDVVDYALSIPAEYKIVNGMEKWILRRAVADLLPDRIVQRRKAKFWEGAGVEERIAAYAEEQVTDADFARERNLPNGGQINSKEELFYYRIFEARFGRLEDLSWVGRTKGAPVE
jgi:asparagine synthase (glutamine-hydrolysing)